MSKPSSTLVVEARARHALAPERVELKMRGGLRLDVDVEADDRTADVPHTYANLSGAPARALLVITPTGFERYFARIGVERQDVKRSTRCFDQSRA